MTTNGQQFHKAFLPYGGLLQIAPENGSLKNVVDELKKFANESIHYVRGFYPTLPDIYVDFIDSAVMNAAACKFEGQYFIGINWGTYFLLMDMFHKMLATKSVLPNIGNPDLESDEKKQLSARIIGGFVGFDDYIIDPIFPKDKHRAHIATMYVTLAMHFLVLHEIGHIVRGHVDLLESSTGFATLNEYEERKFLGLSTDVRQTLEMDADSFAINHAYLTITWHINQKKRFGHIIDPIYGGYDIFYKNWLFAVYSMFRLVGLHEFQEARALAANHPPPFTRMHMLSGNVATIFLVKNPDPLKEVEQHFYQSAVDAETAYASVTFDNFNLTLFFQNFFRSESYMFNIRERWNIVRPMLEPFAFGQLPPFTEHYKPPTSSI